MMKWSSEQEVVLSTKGNLLVSASAGSGKTTTMLGKVLRLLDEGADLRRIVLMTFTKASAKEMSEKLVEKIYDKIREGGAEGAKYKRHLNNLPFVNIGTIDGFCYGLMQKYFNVAGCDPSVTMGDEKALEVAFSECIIKVINDNLNSNVAEFMKTAEYFRQNRRFDILEETIKKIINFANCSVDKNKFYELCRQNNVDDLEKYYLYHTKLILPYISEIAKEAYDGAVVCNREEASIFYEIIVGIEKITKENDVNVFFDRVKALPSFSKIKKGKYNNVSDALKESSDTLCDYIKGYKEEVAKNYENYKKSIANVQQVLIKNTLIDLCIQCENEYQEYKKKRNLVDFSDCIRYALKVLNDEKAREEITKSYDYVYIDEYQDTSFLQEELINKLNKGNSAVAVGDVKQAIYHFRNAEPQNFINRMDRYKNEAVGKNIYLNTNYRSVEGILNFTNRVCSEIMQEDFCGINYHDTACLTWGGKIKNVDELPAVTVATYKNGRKATELSKGVYRVKTALKKEKTEELESAYVAQQIVKFVGKREIYENEKKRKINYSDIAILIKRGIDALPITTALKEYGVPHYVTKSGATASPNREKLVDCVRIILNADNDVALYNVLASPIFGFSTEELIKIRISTRKNKQNISLWTSINRYLDDQNGEMQIKNKIEELKKFLKEAQIKATFMKTSEILREILNHNFDVALLESGDEDISEINDFIAHVSGLPCEEDCAEFIYYYDHVFDKITRPPTPNSVAIMTMHASKGLEFPIVFLPYQHRKLKVDNNSKMALDAELGLAVKFYDEEERKEEDTFAKSVISMRKTDEERKELARLMYVAFTRAKNYLVITGERSKAINNVFDGGSIMQWIELTAMKNKSVRDCVVDLEIEEREESVNIDEEVEEDFDFSLIERKYKYEKETKFSIKHSVSEVLRKEERYGENPFMQKSNENAITLGIAVHTVMQKIDFNLSDVISIKNAIIEMGDQGFLTEKEIELVNVDEIMRFLQSDVAKLARESVIYREQPFVLYTNLPESEVEDKVLIQGIIDLLIQQEDGYVVVDFKTGKSDAKVLKERYEKQLELYALAAEKIFGKKVKQKIIYNLTNGIIVKL